MSAVLQRVELDAVFAAGHAVVDDLNAADLTRCSDEAVLDALRDLERLQRRLEHAGYALIAEADTRDLPSAYATRSMTTLLRGLLRLDPGEAHTRAQAAAAAGPRRVPTTGETLAPIFEHVAAAQAGGRISQRHARVVETTIDALPDDVQAERGEQIEAELVGYAEQFDPRQLSALALRLRQHYDPDGPAQDQRRRERERDLSVRQRTDGSGTMTGALSPELAERLLVLFDSLAAPTPDPDGTADPRTAGQRRHDALLTALRRLQCSGTLPSAGGVAATIVVTMTDAAYTSGRGLARLGHGAAVPVDAAFGMAGGDLRLMAVAVDAMNGITAYGHTQRLFTETQRLAIAARDGGCSFPGCDVPPGWCEAHHVLEHADGGPTSVDNGTLLCRYHHSHFDRLGWSCRMINGHPYWRPPRWRDPTQTPVRNHCHQTDLPQPDPDRPVRIMP